MAKGVDAKSGTFVFSESKALGSEEKTTQYMGQSRAPDKVNDDVWMGRAF